MYGVFSTFKIRETVNYVTELGVPKLFKELNKIIGENTDNNTNITKSGPRRNLYHLGRISPTGFI